MTDKLDLDAIEARCKQFDWNDEVQLYLTNAEIARVLVGQDIPALTAALREADKRIERLESENFDLEELLGVSEGQVNDLKNERAQHHEEQTQ